MTRLETPQALNPLRAKTPVPTPGSQVRQWLQRAKASCPDGHSATRTRPQLTRNQASRLAALNNIARAMASTLDEASVLTALRATLSELLPVDSLDMVSVAHDRSDKARLLHLEADSAPTSREISLRNTEFTAARTVLREPKPLVIDEPTSSLWVPIKEGGVARGAFGIKCARPYA